MIVERLGTFDVKLKFTAPFACDDGSTSCELSIQMFDPDKSDERVQCNKWSLVNSHKCGYRIAAKDATNGFIIKVSAQDDNSYDMGTQQMYLQLKTDKSLGPNNVWREYHIPDIPVSGFIFSMNIL